MIIGEAGARRQCAVRSAQQRLGLQGIHMSRQTDGSTRHFDCPGGCQRPRPPRRSFFQARLVPRRGRRRARQVICGNRQRARTCALEWRPAGIHRLQPPASPNSTALGVRACKVSGAGESGKWKDDDTACLTLKARHGVQLGGCCCSFDASSCVTRMGRDPNAVNNNQCTDILLKVVHQQRR